MSSKEEMIEHILKKRETTRLAKAEYYKNHFWEFNKDILGWPDVSENLHGEICHWVTDNMGKRRLLLIPRGHLKSSVITIGYTLWQIAKNPEVRILISNATFSMATNFLYQIKNVLQKNEKFIELYGNLAEDADNWRESQITVAKEGWRAKEPTVSVYGMGGSLTGQHYDVIILDDLVNSDNITTKDQIDKVVEFYKQSLSVLEPGGELLIVGTRWHQSELYGWILDPENNILPSFVVYEKAAYEGEWGEGKLLFPEKFNWKYLGQLKREQGPTLFCTPGESPVIMGDLMVKPISEVEPGDTVIGWDDNHKPRVKLARSKVKKVHKFEADVVELTMESGRIARCTPEHKWFTGRFDKTHRRYKPAKVGSRLQFIFDPKIPELTQEQKERALWLGGFYDGEGSCTDSIFLSQCHVHNKLVCQKLEETLNSLPFNWSNWRREGDGKRGEKTTRKNLYWINEGIEGKKNFVNLCKPIKKDSIADSIYRRGSHFVSDEDKVTDIKPIGKQKVYALETETGNYIVWGYGSSNSSQYMNDPVPEENATFKRDMFSYFISDDIVGKRINYFTTVDPAISQEKEADFTVIMTIAVDESNNWWVVDIFRDKVTPMQLLDQLYFVNAKFRPLMIGIEAVAFQKALQYFIQEEMRKRNSYLPVQEIKPDKNESKDMRIKSLEPRYAARTVFHSKLVKNIDYLEDELLRFPKGKHDDIIDALSYMNQIAYPPGKKKSTRTRTTMYSGGIFK